ncbi:MAG TPA: TraB family protein [Treponema sp.]|nr:TraB family protein [Treponema sp.]
MNDNSLRITLNGKKIILIGTAHISKGSIEEVNRIITDEKPGKVCVELDQGRYTSISQKESWEKLDVSKIFKEGKGFLLIANLVLSGFQRRMGSELGVKPGDEMKAAIETSAALGIPFRLCDREVQTTLRRAWARCGLWSKCKLLASLLASAFSTEKLKPEEIENLKKQNELDGMMGELSDYLPEVKETLIDERDQYLAAKIWIAANEDDSTDQTVAAVVGAGHSQGIKSHLEKIAAGEESSDVSQLDIIPPPRTASKLAGWIIPIVIVALIAVGFFRAGTALTLEMILRWVLWNGSLAAAGCLISLGHPLAILASFLGAPVSSLNPFIGIGMISGLVQVAFCKPRVSDTQTLFEDISSLKGIYRNRISRALLVFFLSSLGGAIGNFISIPAIAGLLIK